MKLYKVALAGVCALAALASVALDSGVDTDKIKKEIRVLQNVIDTTFEGEQRGRDQRLRPNHMDALYLDGQGVLLEVNVGSGGFGFMPGDFSFDFGPAIAMSFDAMEGFAPEVEVGEEIDRAFEEAHQALEEADFAFEGDEMDDSIRLKYREVAKDRAKLMKDVQEKRRDAMKKLHEDKALSDAERQKLRDQAKSLAERIQSEGKAMRDRMDKLRAESDQKWGERFRPFVDEFLGAVCEYGASLKSLPANERLTVVFRNADRAGGQARDLVYVFTKNDLLACRDGKLDAAQLKERAVRYSY